MKSPGYENIPDLLGTAYVHASRVPIMSAHDGRVPIDENFPFEPCPLRGRPHVHGNPHVLRLANVELAGQLPPDTILNSLSSCDGVDCEVIEVYEVEEDAEDCPGLMSPEPESGWRAPSVREWMEEVD